jgi:hypothetical protein
MFLHSHRVTFDGHAQLPPGQPEESAFEDGEAASADIIPAFDVRVDLPLELEHVLSYVLEGAC